MEATGADAFVFALSDPSRDYFRHDLLPQQYKAHRRGSPRPVGLEAMLEYIRATFKVYVKPRLEADDVLGILATTDRVIPGRKIIVTKDKDLQQIPGELLNHAKLELGVRTITEAEADYFHLYQTLVGDTTDGYGGCPRIGPVKAKRILGDESPVSAWGRVVSAFVKSGKTPEYALTQARVARILRATDWDWEKKEPILWNPV